MSRSYKKFIYLPRMLNIHPKRMVEAESMYVVESVRAIERYITRGNLNLTREEWLILDLEIETKRFFDLEDSYTEILLSDIFGYTKERVRARLDFIEAKFFVRELKNMIPPSRKSTKRNDYWIDFFSTINI